MDGKHAMDDLHTCDLVLLNNELGSPNGCHNVLQWVDVSHHHHCRALSQHPVH